MQESFATMLRIMTTKVKSAYLDGAVIDMDTIVALSKPQQEKFFCKCSGAFQAPIASFARRTGYR